MKGFSNNQSNFGWESQDAQMDVEMDLSEDRSPSLSGQGQGTNQDSAMDWESTPAAKEQGQLFEDPTIIHNRQVAAELGMRGQQRLFGETAQQQMANQLLAQAQQRRFEETARQQMASQLLAQSQQNHFEQSTRGQMQAELNHFGQPPHRQMTNQLLSQSQLNHFEQPARRQMQAPLTLIPQSQRFQDPPRLQQDFAQAEAIRRAFDEHNSRQRQQRRFEQEREQEQNRSVALDEQAARRLIAQDLTQMAGNTTFPIPTPSSNPIQRAARRVMGEPLSAQQNWNQFEVRALSDEVEMGSSRPKTSSYASYNSNRVMASEGLRDRGMAQIGFQNNNSTFKFPGVAEGPTAGPEPTMRLDIPPKLANKSNLINPSQPGLLDSRSQTKRGRDLGPEDLDRRAPSGYIETTAKKLTPNFSSLKSKRQRVISTEPKDLEPIDSALGFGAEGEDPKTQELPEDYILKFWGLSDLPEPDANAGLTSVTCTTSPYLGLDHEDSIRILRLDPGTGPILSCRMETARLSSIDLHSSKTSYEAISYVWGDTKNQVEIETPDGIFRITRNLNAALHRLRYPDKPRYIWADAICINQNDDEEKGHQVRLMRRIYQHASKVLVWLGPDANRRSILAYSVICGIASGGTLNGQPVGQANFYSNGVSSAHIPDLVCRDGPPDASYKAMWGAVQDLFSVGWFWRVWCIQEVALANTATIIWGNSEISWRWLGLAAARLRTNYYTILQQYDMAGVFNAYLNYRISHGKLDLDPLKFSFSSLLALTRQYEATDPRDRIFGLLGIPTIDSDPDNGEFFMEPDYSLSALEVHRNLAYKVLKLANSLSLLSSVQHGDDIDKSWPTWIPQWEKVYTSTLAPSEPDDDPKGASLDVPGQINITMPDTLNVRGLEICTVANTLPKRDSSSTAPLIDEDRATFLSNQGIHRSVAWTLTAGKSWYGLQVTDADSHLNDFASHMRQEIPGLAYLFTMYPDANADAKRFKRAATSACNGRRLFSAGSAQFGLGPSAMRAGDKICVLFGSNMPFVLRPEGENYSLVGECYMYGLMEGQAVDAWRNGGLRDRTFSIC